MKPQCPCKLNLLLADVHCEREDGHEKKVRGIPGDGEHRGTLKDTYAAGDLRVTWEWNPE